MRAIVVAGAGRAFSAGFDLDMGIGEGKPDPADVRRALENDFRVIMRFWDSPEADRSPPCTVTASAARSNSRSPAT